LFVPPIESDVPDATSKAAGSAHSRSPIRRSNPNSREARARRRRYDSMLRSYPWLGSFGQGRAISARPRAPGRQRPPLDEDDYDDSLGHAIGDTRQDNSRSINRTGREPRPYWSAGATQQPPRQSHLRSTGSRFLDPDVAMERRTAIPLTLSRNDEAPSSRPYEEESGHDGSASRSRSRHRPGSNLSEMPWAPLSPGGVSLNQIVCPDLSTTSNSFMPSSPY